VCPNPFRCLRCHREGHQARSCKCPRSPAFGCPPLHRPQSIVVPNPRAGPSRSPLRPGLRIYRLTGDWDAAGNRQPALPRVGGGASWPPPAGALLGGTPTASVDPLPSPSSTAAPAPSRQHVSSAYTGLEMLQELRPVAAWDSKPMGARQRSSCIPTWVPITHVADTPIPVATICSRR
jgi:hypothetical protein